MKRADVEKLLRENERQMRDIEQSWEQRLEEARREWEKSHAEGLGTNEHAPWRQMPYITNVNEDPQLSGVIKLCLAEGSFDVKGFRQSLPLSRESYNNAGSNPH